jgi:hypothetical protein
MFEEPQWTEFMHLCACRQQCQAPASVSNIQVSIVTACVQSARGSCALERALIYHIRLESKRRLVVTFVTVFLKFWVTWCQYTGGLRTREPISSHSIPLNRKE